MNEYIFVFVIFGCVLLYLFENVLQLKFITALHITLFFFYIKFIYSLYTFLI